MDRAFPFGFPFPSAFYLTLYVATLVIHAVFMNYVLAGSAYLAAFSLFHRGDREREAADPIASRLRDWLPFMLGATITAGVAPLLFVQILYQRPFYTANLLLFNRWMAILPVLIVGFYLLYLLKSRVISDWPMAVRVAVGCGAFVCFAFVAWSWTENHLLSLNEEIWPEQYARGRLVYRTPELVPRLLVWFAGAFPTMALIVAWQNWYLQRPDWHQPQTGVRRAAFLACGGLIAAAAAAVTCFSMLDEPTRRAVTGSMARPYLVLAAAGVAVQAVAWILQWRAHRLSSRWMAVASIGVALTLLGTSVVRESRRIAAIDVPRLFGRHADAAQVGGLPVFLFFAALNIGLISACLLIVRRSLRRADSAPPQGTASPPDATAGPRS